MKARAGLLAQPDFRLLWTGETRSSLGSSIGGIALSLVALSVLHASVFTVSALTAAAWLPSVLIGLPAGAWADRLPRRPVMIAADVVSVAAFGSVPVAAWCGALTTVQLMFAALAGGTASVWIMLSGLVLSVLVLLPSPLRHLRGLPSREASVEAQAGQDSTELPAPKS